MPTTPTYTDKTLSSLVISKISQAKFDELKNAGLLNEDELYLVENETLDAMGNVVKNVGTPVQNTDAANKAYVDGKTPPVATSSTAGIVKPDGTTITVDANGVISSSGGGGGGGLEGHTVTLIQGEEDAYTIITLVKTDGTCTQYMTDDSGGVESNVFLYIIEVLSQWSSQGMAIHEVKLVTGDITLAVPTSCLQKGTKVTLSNMTTKPIEEITYDDELLVWDFDNGKFSSAKPLWIKSMQVSPFYFRNEFSDGRTLMTVGEPKTGGHRLFNLSKSMFTYSKETVGDEVYSLDGRISHVLCERVDEPCEFYNVITDRHMNLFANGILTSCRFNNLYPIKDMKFVKDKRKLRPTEVYDVPLEYYNGLRLGEQTMDIDEVNKYVGNLANIAVERKI